LEAHFALNEYLITLEANPPWGGTAEVVGGGDEFLCGDTITVQATASDCFHFKNWTDIYGNIITDFHSFTFALICDSTIIANFVADKFDITLLSEPGGTVDSDIDLHNIDCLTEVTLYAHPDSCHNFMGWIEDGKPVSLDTVYTFIVTGNRTLTAHFEIKQFTITAVPNPSQGGTVSITSIIVDCGEEITLIATPYIGYRFINWTEDDVVVCPDSIYTFTVTDTRHLVANFEYVEYLIILLAAPNPFCGDVYDSGFYPLDTTITVRAVAHIGYQFKEWQEDGQMVSPQANYTFLVTGARILTAIFEYATFDVILEADQWNYGTVEVTSGDSLNLPYGTMVTIKATPYNGYTFKDWTYEDGVWFSDSVERTFPVHHSYHLIAHFVPELCTITLTPRPFGGGTVEGGGTFYIGDSTTLKAFPNSNYVFRDWTDFETDTLVSIDPSWTINVEGSRHLYANFVPKNYIITVKVQPSAGGWVEGGAGTFHYLDMDTAVAHANPNYVFVEWQIDSAWVWGDTTYIFPVTQSCTLVAVFRLEQYNVELDRFPTIGGTVSESLYDIPWGTDTVITAFPFDDYEFIYWTNADDGTVAFGSNPQILTVTRSWRLVANFAPKGYIITLDVAPPGGGTVEGAGTYDYGDLITVKAIPDANYAFSYWTEGPDTLHHTPAEYPFTVNRSRHLTAHFAFENYNVILVEKPDTTAGKAYDTEFGIPFGTEKIVRAEAKEPYYFDGWYENNIFLLDDNPYKFTVTQSRYLEARFKKKTHTITLISVMPYMGTLLGGGEIEHGTDHTITAIANDCYEFVKWTETDGTLLTEFPDLSYSFTVEEDHIFIAHFKVTNVDVTTAANPPQGGTTEGEYLDIECGTEVTIKATPAHEYYFTNWTRNGEEVSTANPYTFETEGGHFVANFAQNEYVITLFADPPELGTVTGEGTFPYGMEHTVNAHPIPGYSLVSWTEDDEEIYYEEDYPFTIERSRTLTAHFEKTIYIVNVIPNDTLYGNTTGSGTYDLNYLVTAKAFAKEGYQFLNWTIDDQFVSSSPIYEFEVTQSVTIVANFYGLDFDTYAATLWDNTFMLNLRLLTDEGYDVTDCKWFKNGKEEKETHTIDAYSYSAGPKPTDLLELDPVFYSFQIMIKNGSLLNSTIKKLIEYESHYVPLKSPLFVYPNPVMSGETFKVEGATQGSMIEVYNQYGVCVNRTTARNEIETMSLNLPAGVYIIRNDNKTTRITIIR
jgi:hypothetical protein